MWLYYSTALSEKARVLDHWSRGPDLKIISCLQARLSFSALQGQSNEYQELLGNYFSPCRGSDTLRQLSTIQKKEL